MPTEHPRDPAPKAEARYVSDDDRTVYTEVEDGTVWTTYRDGTPLLRWPHADAETMLPETFEGVANLRSVPYGVQVWMQIRHGNLECTSLRVHGTRDDRHLDQLPRMDEPTLLGTRQYTEISSRGLRKVPVDRVVRLVTLTALRLATEPGGSYVTVDLAEWDALYKTLPPKERAGALTEEDFRRVADVYRSAVASGHPPTKTVADTLGYSRSRAAALVSEARTRGHLGPAPRKGRAGEIDEKGAK